MNIKSLRILLVEDNLADAELIGELLEQENILNIDIKNVNRVKDALDLLISINFDIVLLDLSLPDSQGIDSIVKLRKQKPNIPIVVLTMLNDLNTAIRSVRKGAQDYLVKNSLEGELLLRSIRYAIERQRNEKAWRQRAERERLMGKMLERIRQSLDLEIILQTTVDEVRQFLQTDRVTIHRFSAEASGEIIVQSPQQQQVNNSFLRHVQRELVTDRVGANGSKTNNYLVQSIEPLNRTQSQETQVNILDPQEQVKALLTLPIWQSRSLQQITDSLSIEPNHNFQQSENKLWGTLVAHNYNKSRQWQSWEIDFLKQLATQVAIAIQQSELYAQLRTVNAQLQKLAIQDSLTGVANRRHFEQTLNREWQRLTREQKPLSLVLCDVDFFKKYNDTYGHPAGDACLKEIAKVMTRTSKRPADLVARYGGEEFAIILPDTSDRGALFVADTIRQQVEKLKLPHQKSPISTYVTLSMGVATQVPSPHQNIHHLIQQADRALYQAKTQGRNQVNLFSSKDW